jgi:hypothetical protein
MKIGDYRHITIKAHTYCVIKRRRNFSTGWYYTVSEGDNSLGIFDSMKQFRDHASKGWLFS